MKCMEDVGLKTVFNPPMSHIIHSFSLSSFDMILRVAVLTLMKELWEYCLEDLRETMEVPVGNLRCTDTSPTPNLVKTDSDVVKR